MKINTVKRKSKKKKWRIKTRVFTMLLLLLGIVFSSVFIAFNLFINSYTVGNVSQQLDGLVDSYGAPDDRRFDRLSDERLPDDRPLPDLSRQPKNKLGARAEVFTVDAGYSVREGGENGDAAELARIAACLREKNAELDNVRYVFVQTEQGEYYISAIADRGRPDSYLIFYVSVTGINNLVDTVNLVLALIMAAAMVISFLTANVIAGSVTAPVKRLARFAEDIGGGNFARNEFCFRDVEFEELGEAMNRSAEKLDKYENDQRAFFQNASHELRTPLMAIRCYAEGIECGLMEPEKSSATIISETDRLGELVEDILYISRVDSLERIEKHENDLRDTLALCAQNLKPVADKKGIAIEYRFDKNPVLLAYNEKHMYRAFANLISNALRYAKHTITLCCRQYNGQVEVSVTDDGEGVSPEDAPHIFERFYRGRGGKHGIGLAIVKSVAELHEGEVSVDCSEGTRFTLRF